MVEMRGIQLMYKIINVFINLFQLWLESAICHVWPGMGCDGSKVADVIETKQQVPQEELDFSDQETDTIRSTWPILAADLERTGIKVFLRVFYEEPKIKLVFKRFR